MIDLSLEKNQTYNRRSASIIWIRGQACIIIVVVWKFGNIEYQMSRFPQVIVLPHILGCFPASLYIITGKIIWYH